MRFTNEELSDFFSELEGLVRAGIPLNRDIGGEGSPTKVRRLWRHIAERLERGESLSAALEQRLREQSPASVALLRAGEATGDLATPLATLAEGHRRAVSLERAVRLACLYPFIVLLFLVGLFLFLGWVILPEMRQLFEFSTQGRRSFTPQLAPLQLATAMATPMGTVLSLAAVAGLIAAALSGIWTRPGFRRRVLTRIPGLCRAMALGSAARWCHTVGHLLSRGTPMPEALTLAEATLEMRAHRQASREIARQIEAGSPLSVALLNVELLPRAAAASVAGAEKGGTVDQALLRLADHLQERHEHEARRFLLWLEPVLIVLVGMLVVATLAAVMHPLFGFPRLF